MSTFMSCTVKVALKGDFNMILSPQETDSSKYPRRAIFQEKNSIWTRCVNQKEKDYLNFASVLAYVYFKVEPQVTYWDITRFYNNRGKSTIDYAIYEEGILDCLLKFQVHALNPIRYRIVAYWHGFKAQSNTSQTVKPNQISK